jgi:chorismate mutase
MSSGPPAFHAIHVHGRAAANRSEDIRATVGDLLKAAVEDRGFQRDAVVSALFATGSGLDAMFPATAARESGLSHAALMSVQRAGGDADDRTIEALIHFHVI